MLMLKAVISLMAVLEVILFQVRMAMTFYMEGKARWIELVEVLAVILSLVSQEKT